MVLSTWKIPFTNLWAFFCSKSIVERCEICSKLTIKIPERRQCRRSGVFIVNFEHISKFIIVFLLLIGIGVFFITSYLGNFEQVFLL